MPTELETKIKFKKDVDLINKYDKNLVSIKILIAGVVLCSMTLVLSFIGYFLTRFTENIHGEIVFVAGGIISLVMGLIGGTGIERKCDERKDMEERYPWLKK